jgi:CxxC motif-containing protein (DUF1111 family)
MLPFFATIASRKARYSVTRIASCLLAIALFRCSPNADPDPGYETGEELSGGSSTTFDITSNAFGNASPLLTSEELDQFEVGNSFFRNNWVSAPSSTTARDGAGPMLNSFSCGGCHERDGRGLLVEKGQLPQLGLLVRFSIPGTDAHGGPLSEPMYGGQLSNRAIQTVGAEGDVQISYSDVKGAYADGASYELRKPTYVFENLAYGPLAGDVLFSPRLAQQIPGLGLLENVAEGTILAFADANDANNDGISGRPNYVWDIANQRTVLGRFGWKANQPSLRQQAAAAFQGDISITTSLFPEENLSSLEKVQYGNFPNGGIPEISDQNLEKVNFYLQTLAVPARRNWKSEAIIRGKKSFIQANCSGCHVPKMQTADQTIPASLGKQTIRPYTDLLLHDMGEGLADNRPDFLATGREWRTPPLWGIGLVKTVNGGVFLLHDGRARNLEEAILWHGGEAEKSVTSFKAMSKAERTELIQFLESL